MSAAATGAEPFLDPPICLSLFAGPGAGKSTTAALTFGQLKLAGVRAELVTEFAKELTYEERHRTLAQQEYVFAKQLQRLRRLRGKVDVIVTDSPLLLSLVYGDQDDRPFREYIQSRCGEFDNLNVRLTRHPAVHPYQAYGRGQTEAEAHDLDQAIHLMLIFEEHMYENLEVTPGNGPALVLAQRVGQRLKERREGAHA